MIQESTQHQKDSVNAFVDFAVSKGFNRDEIATKSCRDSVGGFEGYFICGRDADFDKFLSSAFPGNREFTIGGKTYQVVHLERDPDVLDTWFSSGLWPLSTLDWPNDSALSTQHSALNIWNPTSVLCTAREIITLWVSRMVMFNLYFTDPAVDPRSKGQRLPFKDVFIHAMIQDGHGQKMSKSLGNGVDPMDIIGSHGTDAMRFTLAHMATNTQDVRMPVDLVDPHSGEAFTPKYVTDSAGYTVAAPIQESPKDPKKKMVSSYGYATGKATPTAEMPVAKNTSAKFDLGRNFCNKLWNASRFVMGSLEEKLEVGSEKREEGSGFRVQGSVKTENPNEPRPAIPEPRTLNPEPFSVDESKWSLPDRWIVSRFNRTVEEVNAALNDYRFDNYARTVYDFFWRDFCDWYVEAVKPAMKDPNRSGQTAAILAALLDGTLRILHPVIPFVTEVIWQKLNETRLSRGLPGRIEFADSQLATRNSQLSGNSALLIKAAWPTVGSFSEAAEFIFPKLQEIIGAIRNVRNQYNVSPRQSVIVSIAAPAEPARQITENREMIELMAICTIKEIGAAIAPPANSIRASAAGVEVFVEGLVDPAADQQRITKLRDELTKKIAAMKGRLANVAYTSKAPPHLVKQTQDQLAEAEAELAKLG